VLLFACLKNAKREKRTKITRRCTNTQLVIKSHHKHQVQSFLFQIKQEHVRRTKEYILEKKRFKNFKIAKQEQFLNDRRHIHSCQEIKSKSRQLDIHYKVIRQVEQRIASNEASTSLCSKKKMLRNSICDVDVIEEEINI